MQRFGRQAEGQGPRLLTWAVKKRSPSGLPEPALLQPRLLVPGREGSVNLEGGPFIRAPVLLVGPERWRSIAAERDVRSARALWFNADSCSLAGATFSAHFMGDCPSRSDSNTEPVVNAPSHELDSISCRRNVWCRGGFR